MDLELITKGFIMSLIESDAHPIFACPDMVGRFVNSFKTLIKDQM